MNKGIPIMKFLPKISHLGLLLVAGVLLSGCGGDEEKDKNEAFFADSQPAAESPKPKEVKPTLTAAPAVKTTVATTPPQPVSPDAAPIETVELEDGLKYDKLAEGDDKSSAVVEGKLANFDLVFQIDGQPEPIWQGKYGFVVGSGMGFSGLDKTVRGMKVGETRRLTVPSSEAVLPTGNRLPGLAADDVLIIMATLTEVTDSK